MHSLFWSIYKREIVGVKSETKSENQTNQEQRNKEPRKHQVVINIMMGIESSYVSIAEGYFSLEATRDSSEWAMLRLTLKGSNI